MGVTLQQAGPDSQDEVMMRFFSDTECIEDGRTLDVISIGMVAENGNE